MIKVLSIDGGGIRGIIPAILLAEIEKRTGKPISNLFHLIAGTSTGGILALGLVKPDKYARPQYSARQLIDFYEQEGSKIFSRTLWHRISSLDSLIAEKYTSKGVEEVLKKYFDNITISKALTDIIITSYETERRIPWFFKSRDMKKFKKGNQDFLMWQVARATSAAPTYFQPTKVDINLDKGLYSFVDGGMFSSNPAMCAYSEAASIYGSGAEYMVVSLGTGEYTRPLLYKNIKKWGLAKWAQPILGVVFDGVNDTVDYQLRQLLSPLNGVQRYYRFQTRLDIANDDMDDSSPKNISSLKILAKCLIKENHQLIDELCKKLT